MNVLLAYAESADTSTPTKVLGGLAIIAIVAALSAVLIGISRSRGNRYADSILVATFFWGVITGGVLIWAWGAHLSWQKEYTMRIESGYFDPRNTSDAPASPWILCLSLAAVYAALLAWSLVGGVLTEPPV